MGSPNKGTWKWGKVPNVSIIVWKIFVIIFIRIYQKYNLPWGNTEGYVCVTCWACIPSWKTCFWIQFSNCSWSSQQHCQGNLKWKEKSKNEMQGSTETARKQPLHWERAGHWGLSAVLNSGKSWLRQFSFLFITLFTSCVWSLPQGNIFTGMIFILHFH